MNADDANRVLLYQTSRSPGQAVTSKLAQAYIDHNQQDRPSAMAYKLVKLKRAHFKPSRHRFEGAAAMGLGEHATAVPSF